MVFMKKSVKPTKETKVEAAPEEVQVQEVVEEGKCACGEPVAKDLGQNQVCKKHIKAI